MLHTCLGTWHRLSGAWYRSAPYLVFFCLPATDRLSERTSGALPPTPPLSQLFCPAGSLASSALGRVGSTGRPAPIALWRVLRHTPRRSPPAQKNRWTSAPSVRVGSEPFFGKNGLCHRPLRYQAPEKRCQVPKFWFGAPRCQVPKLKVRAKCGPPVEVAEWRVSDWVKLTGRAFEVRRDKDVASSRPTKETRSEGTRRATPRESTFRPFWCLKRVTPPVGAPLPAGRKILGTEHCSTRHLKDGARYLGK